MKSMRALILAFGFNVSYHVLRLTREAGYSTYVLGRDGARGLRYSRFCNHFQYLDFDPRSQSLDAALAEIKRVIAEISADVILPADVVSTRLLAALADRLPIPSYPLPAPATFDIMNNKWEFYRFCKEHNAPVPDTMLFDDIGSLKKALAQSKMTLPVIIKPLNSMANSGIHPILSESDLSILDTIQYKPILMQKYISGEWGCIDLLASHGRIVAHAERLNLPGRRAYGPHEKMLAGAARIVEACGYHGVACFDTMQDATTGKVYFLECNPRFWYSISATRLAGINFVKTGLIMSSLDPAKPLSTGNIDICQIKAIVKKGLTFSKLSPIETQTFRYFFADPMYTLCHLLKIFDDGRSRGPGSIEGQVTSLAALQASAT